MRNVLIATPSYDGKVDVWFANSLVNSIRLGLANEVNFVPIYMSYDSLVQRARNDLLAIAVENGFDDIIWIDADMEWDPIWLLELLNHDADVVGGTARKKSLDEMYVVKCKPENLVKNEAGLIEVEGLGTGFLRMSKKAFTYLWDNSEAYVHNGAEKRWAFAVEIKDGDIISEDIHVCQKLSAGGFKLYFDPKMTCAHVGTLKFTGNFEEWAERLKESL
jgi:hypothetical protein